MRIVLVVLCCVDSNGSSLLSIWWQCFQTFGRQLIHYPLCVPLSFNLIDLFIQNFWIWFYRIWLPYSLFETSARNSFVDFINLWFPVTLKSFLVFVHWLCVHCTQPAVYWFQLTAKHNHLSISTMWWISHWPIWTFQIQYLMFEISNYICFATI